MKYMKKDKKAKPKAKPKAKAAPKKKAGLKKKMSPQTAGGPRKKLKRVTEASGKSSGKAKSFTEEVLGKAPKDDPNMKKLKKILKKMGMR